MKKLFKNQDAKILALSFFLPVVTLLFCFAIRELTPLGGRSLLSMDGFSQYYPMLMNMSESIKSGELFYSFKGALGFNLWAQSAYYTNSPFWLLVYFLPHEAQLAAIDLIVLFKIAFASLFFAFYLIKKGSTKKEGGRVWLYVLLSMAYGMSGYMLAFVNQLMWTDVIMLLPLTVLGLEELYEKGKPTLYVITLFLSVFSCYYISYMLCIFLCLYFVYLAFREKQAFSLIFKKGLLFTFWSVVAGLMAAVSLFPAVKAVGLTLASEIGFGKELEIKYNILEFLLRLLPFNKASLEYGAPNLYCSVTAVVLMLVFFFKKSCPLRQRLVSLAFVTFMSLSMCINLGEYIWHGFHFPNQLPARQSFLLIFLILIFAEKGAAALKIKEGKEKKHFYRFAAAGVALSFFISFSMSTWASRNESLQRYEESFEKVKTEIGRDDFYRMAWTDEKKNNQPQQNGYNGICYYSSTMSADAYNFFQNLGMERYAKNVSTHYNGSEILNDLFGIEYILEEKLVFENAADRFVVKENKNALPIGYLSKKAVVDLDLSEYEKGKEAQQALFDAIAPEGDEEYEEKLDYLHKNSLKTDQFESDKIRGRIKTEKDGVLLFSIPFDEGWTVYIDGEEVQTKKAAGYLLCCDIEKGEHLIHLRYSPPGFKAGLVVSVVALISFVDFRNFAFKKRKKESLDNPENF